MALSPPPRFRQSFQSARRPRQMPVLPMYLSEKSSAALHVLPDGGLALVAEGDHLVEEADVSPVSLTYSQIEGISHRWSSEQVCSMPWM